MNINQKNLNDLVSIMQPRSSLDMLKERREALLRNITPNISTAGNNENSETNVGKDIKHTIEELREIDQQIQAEIYEEETRKLEIERLKREEAAAKNFREREKVLARHEATLDGYSFNKLLSADGKARQLNTMAKSGVSVTLTNGPLPEDKGCGSSLTEKTEEINGDIKESVEYGIAAAEVAVRRKRERIKAEIEEAALEKKRNMKKKKKHIDVVL